MTLPDGPVPGDIYETCKALVANAKKVPTDRRERLREWAGRPEGLNDRELAAKVVIHAAQFKTGIARECAD